MINRKVLISLFFVVLFTFGAGSIIYTMVRLNSHPEFVNGEFDDETKDIEKARGQSITLTETEDGERKWVLKMQEIKYSQNKDEAFLKGVKGLVYGDNDKVLFTFKAPKGLYYKTKQKIVLDGGAKMVSPSAKAYIQSPHMEWSSQTGNVIATGGVKMAKKGVGSTKANTASFPMDFSELRFTGNTQSVIGG